MNYSLLLLDDENLDLKKQILIRLSKRALSLEDLVKIGKCAIQSSLYDLEQEGFITLKKKNEKIYYNFNRSKILFKIQMELEKNFEKLKKKKEFYSNNTLFYCSSCNNFVKYIEAMEKEFICCGKKLSPVNTSEIIEDITNSLENIKEKLKALNEI